MYAPVILFAIILLFAWPMLSRQSGVEPPVDEPIDQERLRALGYVNLHDRWVNASLRIWTPTPSRLLACDDEQLDAFHAPETWSDIRAPQRPHLPPDLTRAARELELRWFGWLDAWFFPSGAGISARELEQLGADGLRGLTERIAEFHRDNDTKKRAGCVGLAMMFFWLVAGWQWGSTAWLLGMATIAVGSWLFRPMRATPELWGGVREVTAQDALRRGRDLLGEEWSEVAYITAAIPAEEGHLHLMNLEQNISIANLRGLFTPNGIKEILHNLVPIDEAE